MGREVGATVHFTLWSLARTVMIAPTMNEASIICQGRRLSLVPRSVGDPTSHDNLVGAGHRCPNIVGLDEVLASALP
jgi:hypothetical protein